jgi:hypothetical protein
VTTERSYDSSELQYIRRGTTIVIDIDVRDAAHWIGFDTPAPEPVRFDPSSVEGRLTMPEVTVVDWTALTRIQTGQYRWIVEIPMGTVAGMLNLDLKATTGLTTTQTTMHSIVRVLD